MDSSEIDRTGVSICQETISRMYIIFRELSNFFPILTDIESDITDYRRWEPAPFY